MTGENSACSLAQSSTPETGTCTRHTCLQTTWQLGTRRESPAVRDILTPAASWSRRPRRPRRPRRTRPTCKWPLNRTSLAYPSKSGTMTALIVSSSAVSSPTHAHPGPGCRRDSWQPTLAAWRSGRWTIVRSKNKSNSDLSDPAATGTKSAFNYNYLTIHASQIAYRPDADGLRSALCSADTDASTMVRLSSSTACRTLIS